MRFEETARGPLTVSDADNSTGVRSLALSGPASKGPTGTFLQMADGATGELSCSVPAGAGDVSGPAASTDNAVARDR